MLKYQDEYGNEKEPSEMPDNWANMQYHLFAQLQEMGNLLNISGKFRMQYGTLDIINAIKALQGGAK